jgi:hypothetical protein
MRWVRAKIRIGTGLALCALALQLVLSLGHVHLAAVGPIFGKAVASASASGTAPHDQNGSQNDVCPVCALVHLTSISAPPIPPALPLRAMPRLLRPQAGAAFAIAASASVAFQARASPRA